MTLKYDKTDIKWSTKLAEQHWEFLSKWFKMIFIDGFVHGWKHAIEQYEE